jgi:hypothetical protein
MTPSAPASAYFVSKLSTTRDQRAGTHASDTPGAIFVTFQFDPVISIITDGLVANSVNIAFSRRTGGADVPIAIDTSVEDTLPDGSKRRSRKTAVEFSQCAKNLIQGLSP